MLRSVYFTLAMVSALLGILSTFAGFIYMVYWVSVGGLTLEQAMHQGTAVGMITSTASILGWILFSYLFVREDDRLENEP